MKKIFLAVAAMLFATFAFAQTYPVTAPQYIPNAVGPTTSFSAPGDYTFNAVGVSTVSVRVSGTCTSLAAVAQGSNDGTNYTAINLYPIATGTTAPVAVASISAAGFWKVNSQGFTKVRLHITALTAACAVTMVGSPGAFNGTTF